MASNIKRKIESSSKDVVPTKKKVGHWAMGLKQSMEDPDLVVLSDDKITIIKDKYPKSKYHFLVMPKESIPNLKSLKPEHLSLLKYMEEKGKEVSEKSGSIAEFRFGYHAIPSMSHIHLHVISQDFDSECLKTKKHWNSFTSEYFINSKDVIEMLEKNGRVHFDTSKYEQILKQPLKCHKCSEVFPTIPKLKAHILKHIAK